jgi:hypothetical protein
MMFTMYVIMLLLFRFTYAWCPHFDFEDKHVCRHCSTEADALHFTSQRRPVPVNHVLHITDPIQYSEDDHVIYFGQNTCYGVALISHLWKCIGAESRCELVHSYRKCAFWHSSGHHGHFLIDRLDCNVWK